ncbi:hypothetical protein PTNB73_09379 [Pyrenophora teres f. teres]|uniref:GMC oxidoreductase n=1 Tax=Pyrenophora teres f. teres TaxID=97479 RepID=A0A6S6W7F2_9PLEO|nr:hypothetical protein HRS9139_08979 [Pyrenophora teres f. teres]KAE8856657.1 hypothetical protein PTNB73_09379 [Pyrenophora teres f. teres]KAE8861257.1 hypothetical protein PTNB29_06352 [Pyrenophora teres f. teres]CAE7193136.1 GMC oxidoreductase [Pyrenophora teres f. teres]
MPAKILDITAGAYDFIVVGAGSASCLIASCLSQQLLNHPVLVLEAGEHIRNDRKVQTPGLATSLLSNPTYDWDCSSAPEPGLNEKIVKHPRGKLVGGSSAINSHSVVFPNHEWHDRIADELLSGPGREVWSSQGISDCNRRWQAEQSRPSVDEDVGSLDHVQTSFPRTMDLIQSRWMEAFKELGHSTNPTGFVESSAGAVSVTNAIDVSKGERSHAGTAFLEPALKRGSVTLKTGVKVDRIAFDEGEAHLISGREIIPCAGAFESSVILKRSGIGSKDVLAAANVTDPVRASGVGKNLQDHINCGMSFETKGDIPTRDDVLRNPQVRQAALIEYEKSRTGRLSEGVAYSFAFTPLQMLETAAETQEFTQKVQECVGRETNPNLKAQYALTQKAIESPSEATATTFMLHLQRHKYDDSLPNNTPSVVDGNYITVVAMPSHPFSRGSCHITPNHQV